MGENTLISKRTKSASALKFSFAGAALCALLSTTAAGPAAAASCVDNSDPTRTTSVEGSSFMVAAANPLAVKAGCDVLKDGGTAIDAAVAVQAALSVVEPQSSGLAGGAIITYWDNDEKRVRQFEGLSGAPQAVTDGLRTPTEEDIAACGLSEPATPSPPAPRSPAGRFGVPGALRAPRPGPSGRSA